MNRSDREPDRTEPSSSRDGTPEGTPSDTASSSGRSVSSPDETERSRRAAEVAAIAEQREPGLAREFAAFLISNKKWWLAPLLASFVLLGWLSWLSAGSAGPFIYTLF